MADRYAGKAIMIKVKAMYGRWLKEADYREIVRLDSIDAIATYLKQHSHYAYGLRALPDIEAPRYELERLLKRDVFSSYLAILRYDRSPDSFYRYLMTEMEIQQLIACLHYVYSANMESFLLDVPGFLIPYASVDFVRIAEARTFGDVLAALRRTPYYEILRPFWQSSTDSFDHLGAETALKLYGSQHVMQHIRSSTSATEGEALNRFYYRYLELTNLALIHRLKTFMRVEPDLLRTYLLPTKGRLHPKEYESLIQAPTVDDFLERLQETALGRKLSEVNGKRLQDIRYFERATMRLHFQDCRKMLRFAHDGPSCFLAFVMLNSIELSNLMTLIESRRYPQDTSLIEPLLIY
jgi:Archaeal/vacuolar-type H+-ATPase subunit C